MKDNIVQETSKPKLVDIKCFLILSICIVAATNVA